MIIHACTLKIFSKNINHHHFFIFIRPSSPFAIGNRLLRPDPVCFDGQANADNEYGAAHANCRQFLIVLLKFETNITIWMLLYLSAYNRIADPLLDMLIEILKSSWRIWNAMTSLLFEFV